MAVRPHTFIIGAQPDYLSLMTSWFYHGREFVAGDAEKTHDLAPSTRDRGVSVGSGERIYQADLSTILGIPIVQVVGVVHNLADIGAKARAVLNDGAEFRYPTGSSGSNATASGAASLHAAVENDPHGGISSKVTPTAPASDWDAEFTFASSTALELTVADSQLIFVRLRYNGTYTGSVITRTVTIEVKEGATVIVSKGVRVRAEDGYTLVTSVLVDPNDFVDKTLSGMSVKVYGQAVTGIYQELESVAWLRFPDHGTGWFDSGWVPVETGNYDRYYISESLQESSIRPSSIAMGSWCRPRTLRPSRQRRCGCCSTGMTTSWRVVPRCARASSSRTLTRQWDSRAVRLPIGCRRSASSQRVRAMAPS